MKFSYKAIGADGAKMTGTLEAAGKQQALDQLSGMGLRPLALEEMAGAGEKRELFRGRVKAADVENFIRELASLLSSGVPLSRALDIICREASSSAIREEWKGIRDEVADGKSLADALLHRSKLFSPVYVAMVRAGETGGFLAPVLEQIAEFRSREEDLSGKIVAALVYPAVLAVLATGVIIFLMIYFIPRFSTIFDNLGGQLPVLTQYIVACSNFMINHTFVLAVGVVLGWAALRQHLSTERGKLQKERFLLWAPGVGNVAAGFALVRFCRTLGTLLESGVPMLQSLRVAREAIGNQTLAVAVDDSIESVQRGGYLCESLRNVKGMFPASAIEMIGVAEESGRLHQELNRLANSFEKKLDRQLRMLVSLAEPILLFIMAAMVGTVVIGMLLPVFALQDLVR